MMTPESLRHTALVAASLAPNATSRNVFSFIADGLEIDPVDGAVRGVDVNFGSNETLAALTLSCLGISTRAEAPWHGTGVCEQHTSSGTSYLGGALPAMAADNPVRAIKAVGVNVYNFTRNKAGAAVAKRQRYSYTTSGMGYMLTTTGDNREGSLAAEVNLTVPITANAAVYANLAAIAFGDRDLDELRYHMRSSEAVALAVRAQAEYMPSGIELHRPMFRLRIGQLGRSYAVLGWPAMEPAYASASVQPNGSLQRHRS